MIRMFAAIRSTLLAAGWILGIPAALVSVAGSPIPPRQPTTAQIQAWFDDPINPVYKEETAQVLAWTAWAMITIVILAALAHRVRRAPWGRLIGHLPPPMQSLAATILGAAAVATSTSTPVAPPAASTAPASGPQDITALPHDGQHATTTPTGTQARMPAAPQHDVEEASRAFRRVDAAAAVRTAHTLPAAHGSPRTVITIHQTTAALPQHNPTHQRRGAVPTQAPDAPSGVHHVLRGDNLWDIAKDKLDDPYRWREIYALNRGHEQTDGYALTDPDEIHTGWVLGMPATPPAPNRPHTSTPPAFGSASPHAGTTPTGPGDNIPAPQTSTAAPSPATSTPTGRTPPATRANSDTASPPASPAPTRSTPASTAPTHPEPSTTTTPADHSDQTSQRTGIVLPSQGWISLGLAALIAAVGSLLRLQQRRHAKLSSPIPTRIAAQPTPVPECLAVIDTVAVRPLTADNDLPPNAPPAVLAAPVGLDHAGQEMSLLDLPGPGIALTGDGAEPAARAVLAAALATGATGPAARRPVVVTTAELLTRLLPDGAPVTGLDPDGTSFDGERLIVLNDAAAAITHAEEEMIVRRRLLDTFDLDAIDALNQRTDHAETQPPYVLLTEAAERHAGRLLAVGAHRAALDLHPVIVGAVDGIPQVEVAADGTRISDDAGSRPARMSTLTADDLAAVLTMLATAASRPEPGLDLDRTPAQTPPDGIETLESAPVQPSVEHAPVRLRILGPMMVATEAGPVTTGMRSGSYLVLTSLAVHPSGRSLDQLVADLHPDTDPTAAGKRIRTDISTTRRVLRNATGLAEPMFIVYDAATSRYHLDTQLITVDLWQMLAAIETANHTDNDNTALAALREAARLYDGDLAEGHDQTWITDHATTYRHQILSVHARIAELLEADHPDEAVAALEKAMDLDPINEELYQRIMRIHGRAGRPDQVRRTLRRLEERLADLVDAEPSEATRRVAQRQLRPATTTSVGAHR